MKRVVLLALTLLVLLLPALSCSPPPAAVTAAEVFPAARALLEASVPVNEAFLGGGIPVASGTAAVGAYYPADEAWLKAHGIGSVDALRAAAEAVYTQPIIALIYAKAFPSDVAYDYQVRSVAEGDGILVLITREPMWEWYEGVTYEYLYDTMTLTAAGKSSATVALTVRIEKDGYPPQERSLSLPLLLTEEGWRCDKLTCVAYDTGTE